MIKLSWKTIVAIFAMLALVIIKIYSERVYFHLTVGIHQYFYFQGVYPFLESIRAYFPFRVSNPVAIVKFLQYFEQFFFAYITVHFLFSRKDFDKIALIVSGGWLGVGLFINIMGKYLHLKPLVATGQEILENLTSPIHPGLLIPLLVLRYQLEKNYQAEKIKNSRPS